MSDKVDVPVDVEVADTLAILEARDLGIAEFHAMQLPLAMLIRRLAAPVVPADVDAMCSALYAIEVEAQADVDVLWQAAAMLRQLQADYVQWAKIRLELEAENARPPTSELLQPTEDVALARWRAVHGGAGLSEPSHDNSSVVTVAPVASAEVEAIMSKIVSYASIYDDDDFADMAALYREQIEAMLRSLSKDAERYRWLRKELSRTDPMFSVVAKAHFKRWSSEWCNFATAANMDAAIDAALAAKE